jgi:hypothetical protein
MGKTAKSASVAPATYKAGPKIVIPIAREEAIAKGLDRYFTGEPCKYGDIAERDVTTGACLKCRALICETETNEKGAKERQSLNCKQCGSRFRQKRNDQVFCSSECRLEHWKAMPVAKNCEQCGAPFTARKNAIFCSPKCRLAHWQPTLKGPDLFA